HVAHQRREVLDDARAQRPDVHPGAGGELEVLGDSAAEQETFFWTVKNKGIAEAVPALLVERLARELGLAPVTRRDVRALDARFVLSFHRHELDLAARGRHAHVARVVAVPGAAHGIRRGLGGAEAGEEQNLLAAGLAGK